MTKRQTREGRCRICGVNSLLTIEHILPRAAGGGSKTKIYTGEEVIKAVVRKQDNIDEDVAEIPYGRIKQNGYAEYTLCKSCNSYAGRHYDKEFSNFYNAVKHFIYSIAKEQSIETAEGLDEYLLDKAMGITLSDVKPQCIAKRVLVAFCSVDHSGLTDRKPEIRKAIMNKDYRPDVGSFSIYFAPHIGSNGYFGTLAALTTDGEVHSYAGIELGPLAFYLSDRDEHLKGGVLSKCINITNWLTDYEFGEEAGRLEIIANFERSFALSIPAWAFESVSSGRSPGHS